MRGIPQENRHGKLQVQGVSLLGLRNVTEHDIPNLAKLLTFASARQAYSFPIPKVSESTAIPQTGYPTGVYAVFLSFSKHTVVVPSITLGLLPYTFSNPLLTSAYMTFIQGV